MQSMISAIRVDRGTSMEIRLIKTDDDYIEALKEVERLIDLDPNPGTPEDNKLEILSFLVEKYEEKKFSIGMPDPIEAIKYRMNELNLTNKDLVKYLGSKSKVSEVLNKKIPLSLRMIRNLHNELGVPAEVLLQDPEAYLPEEIEGIDWQKFPLQELRKKGWIAFSGTAQQAKEKAEEIIRDFFRETDYVLQPINAHLRQNVRSNGKQNEYSLQCWLAKVKQQAHTLILDVAFDEKKLDAAFLQSVVRLSTIKNGPIHAAELLKNIGVKVVVVPHLRTTHLDGACLWDGMGSPVIALTLRHDRLDNFWFTLFHELGHLKKHMKSSSSEFLDDLEAESKDKDEIEADDFAADTLIPPEAWETIAGNLQCISRDDVIRLSQEITVSPSIIAGRIRKEKKNYRIFKDLVGYREVRKLFQLE